MKKTITIIGLFITFFLLYFIQVNFFNWFTINGISPNIFIILVLFVGLFAGKWVGTSLGISFGIILDLFTGFRVGIAGLLLGLVGYAGGYLDKSFSKDSKLTIILMCMGATLFYEAGIYGSIVLFQKAQLEIIPFIKTVAIEILYNSILVIILYPIMQKTGYSIEETFKGNNILTRYF